MKTCVKKLIFMVLSMALVPVTVSVASAQTPEELPELAAVVTDGYQCSVCWEQDSSVPLVMTACGHEFCLACYKATVEVKETCPMCRASTASIVLSSCSASMTPRSDSPVGMMELNFCAAALVGNTYAVEKFIASPRLVSVDVCDPEDGTTPLMNACVSGNEKAVEVLLAKGADPLVCDNDGWTALDWARSCADSACVKLVLTRAISRKQDRAEGERKAAAEQANNQWSKAMADAALAAWNSNFPLADEE